MSIMDRRIMWHGKARPLHEVIEHRVRHNNSRLYHAWRRRHTAVELEKQCIHALLYVGAPPDRPRVDDWRSIQGRERRATYDLWLNKMRKFWWHYQESRGENKSHVTPAQFVRWFMSWYTIEQRIGLQPEIEMHDG